MIEFGSTLRAAREAKGLSTRQLADKTHLLAQQIEALEREDFSRIAAPIYGRGFVKLCCEVLEIEDKPAAEYTQPKEFDKLTPLFPRQRIILENGQLKLASDTERRFFQNIKNFGGKHTASEYRIEGKQIILGRLFDHVLDGKNAVKFTHFGNRFEAE